MDSRFANPAGRRVGCGSLVVLLALVAGCGQTPTGVEHVEVTGKVLIGGKPLPGGQVSFVTVKGGFAASGNIDENGNYQIKAPVGEVIITVTNTMLQAKKGGGVKGAPAPKNLPHPKQGAEEHAVKGQWVTIPSRYGSADASDLRYKVIAGAGPQTHNIELSTTVAPPPGGPGS